MTDMVTANVNTNMKHVAIFVRDDKMYVVPFICEEKNHNIFTVI